MSYKYPVPDLWLFPGLLQGSQNNEQELLEWESSSLVEFVKQSLKLKFNLCAFSWVFSQHMNKTTSLRKRRMQRDENFYCFLGVKIFESSYPKPGIKIYLMDHKQGMEVNSVQLKMKCFQKNIFRCLNLLILFCKKQYLEKETRPTMF